MIGYALCGSFCTLSRSVEVLTHLKEKGYDVLPIMSEITAATDTRFGKAADFMDRIESICCRPIIRTVPEAEPLGPARPLEALVICPCTGNTLAKLPQPLWPDGLRMMERVGRYLIARVEENYTEQ